MFSDWLAVGDRPRCYVGGCEVGCRVAFTPWREQLVIGVSGIRGLGMIYYLAFASGAARFENMGFRMIDHSSDHSDLDCHQWHMRHATMRWLDGPRSKGADRQGIPPALKNDRHRRAFIADRPEVNLRCRINRTLRLAQRKPVARRAVKDIT
jgi:hypothetical protein